MMSCKRCVPREKQTKTRLLNIDYLNMYLLTIQHRVAGTGAADAQRQQRLTQDHDSPQNIYIYIYRENVKPKKPTVEAQRNDHLFISRCLRGAGDGCRRCGRHARNTR